MLGLARENPEIHGVVVLFVLIFVMDNFAGQHPSPQAMFRYKPVLKDMPPPVLLWVTGPVFPQVLHLQNQATRTSIRDA